MEYEYEDKVVNVLKTFGVLYNSNINFRMAEEVEEVYTKAKLWDSAYDMTTDKATFSKIFDDELYKLLHQTDKSDASIILEIIQLFLDRLERE